MIVAAIVLVAVAAIAAMLRLQTQQQAAVERLLAAQAAERHAWDHQRWELNTRLLHPEVGPLLPPPAPPQAGTEDTPADDDDVDESYLVGTATGAA